MIEKVKPSATVTESPSDLQTFQKRLILHVLVMDNYTLVNRRTNRLEFSGALTEANIATIIAAIEDELKSHFLFACPDCGAKTELEAETSCPGHDTCPMTCCDKWDDAVERIKEENADYRAQAHAEIIKESHDLL